MSSSDSLKNNPLLASDGYPRFDDIQAEHVVPGMKAVLEKAEAILKDLEANASSSWDSLFPPMHRIGRLFEFSWQPVGHLLGVKNSPELREAYEEILGDVVTFSMKFKQSKPIYEAMREIKDSPEIWDSLDEVQTRILTSSLLEAELAGIGLEGDELKRFNEIAQELSQISTTFSNNVLDSTNAYSLIITEKADAEGLPKSLRSLAAQAYNSSKEDDTSESDTTVADAENGPWKITLEVPSCQPFLQHCTNGELREQVYRAFSTRASIGEYDNTELCLKILKLRKEKAELLGYNDHAEVSLATKMAKDVTAVSEMFETLRTASWESAVQDLKDLEELAVKSNATTPLRHWDIAFWSERLREQRYEITDDQIRPYFPHDHVLNGLFDLLNRLLGIDIKAADGEAPVWNDDVRFFHVFDSDSKEQIASFFYDPYSRPENKRGGAWMNECLNRSRIDGDLQLPVAHLICNCTPPVDGKPALMTFREVETLFHEFGHGLQHMLTKVDHADAAGINGVEWDAVELPSQFMENWCYHKPTLMGLTSHFETSESLPDELFEKIVAAKNYRAGSNMLRQLTFGMTDIQLHSKFDVNGDETIFDVMKEVLTQTSVLPMLPEDRMLCAFQHIFSGGYAAGYYSYKWAEVLSADAFSAFEDVGLDNDDDVQKTGRRFRDTVLSLGGGRHPMDVFKDFRGREPDPNALLRHSGLID